MSPSRLSDTHSGIVRRTYLRDGRAPIPKSEVTSRVMSANRGANTSPEIQLRKSLRARGVSNFKLHLSSVPGRPDLAFPQEKLAIFVHGCFWHRCPHCQPSVPKSHIGFWTAKFAVNQQRDQRKARGLRKRGWSVLTIWECQVRKDSDRAADRVSRKLTQLNS